MKLTKSNDQHPSRGGRPAKFAEPSHPVTTTLPDRILALLATIDSDRAAAIVKVVEALVSTPDGVRPAVEEIPAADGKSLVVVENSPLLRTIPWISLLEVSTGRFLISTKPGVSIEKLELAIMDLIESNREASPSEIATLELLLKRLRTPRRNLAVAKEEIVVIHKA